MKTFIWMNPKILKFKQELNRVFDDNLHTKQWHNYVDYAIHTFWQTHGNQKNKLEPAHFLLTQRKNTTFAKQIYS